MRSHGSAMKKWASLLLAFVMMVTILPIPEAEAASFFQLDGISSSEQAPTQVNQSVIDLTGTYQGVSMDTISYKIEVKRDNDWEEFTTGTGVSPILEGANGFSFLNVEISTGLNRITIFANEGADEFYVYFPNVPSIYNIRIDGRTMQAGKATVIDNDEATIVFMAPNATSVTVQGFEAFPAGNGEFIANDIPLRKGLNKLVFTASNETNWYSITRDVVLIEDGFAVYDVFFEDKPQSKLDDSPTLTSSGGIPVKLEGKIAVAKSPSADLQDDDLEISISRGNLPLSLAGTVTINHVEDVPNTVTGSVYDYAIYEFTFENTTATQIDQNGDYVLEVDGDYGSLGINQLFMFQYRSETNPIIQDVLVLQDARPEDPTDPASRIMYTSTARLTDGQFFSEPPIWLAVRTNQFDPTDPTGFPASIESSIASPTIDYERHISSNGELVFKITNMPEGEQTLNFLIRNNGTNEGDERSYAITFVPTPYIHLESPYPNKEFHAAGDFKEVKGRLVNFNLATDRDTVYLTINGTTRQIPEASINSTTGEFTFPIPSGEPALQLVNGPNRIEVSALANESIPVMTTATVFLFPQNRPSILILKPTAVGQSDTDPELFVQGSDNLVFTTTQRHMDVLFTVAETTEVVVSVDGVQYTKTRGPNNDGHDTMAPIDGKLIRVSPTGYQYRVPNLELPESGTMSVTILARQGTTSTSQTLMVTRTPMPYQLLSPKFPEERIINQNFVEVSIRAEGADSVIVNKQEMTKGTDDIFRTTLNNLKKGDNKLDFTITTGDNQSKVTYVVTYAYQNEVGAQYRTTIPSSGKLKNLFDGDLTLEFPKDTMLKQPQGIGGGAPRQVELINNQYVLFGIADPVDGRTIKQYNRVGELNSGGVPLDGNIALIPQIGTATNILQSNRGRRGFASQLFWVDAGYMTNDGKLVGAMHPYASGDYFFNRTSLNNKWLEPTKRGKITLKYDTNIRNEAARNLSIGHFDGRTWNILGGTVNTSKKTVSAPFNGFGYYAVLYVRYGFEDITGHPYARNHLDTIYAKGIMVPRVENSNQFGVYENVTRGEFATMMVKMLDLPLNYDTERSRLTFNDVIPGFTNPLWDYRFIETAARAGIISGMQPRVFNPNGYITREQAASMIARGLNLKLGSLERDRNALTKQFADAGSMDDYFIPAIQAVHRAKIMSGSTVTDDGGNTTNVFRPKANVNRADMAIIAYNIMTHLKKF